MAGSGFLLSALCMLGDFSSDLGFSCDMQALQQGGAFVFDGEVCIWQRYDKATGAHVRPEELMEVIETQLVKAH